MIILAACVLFGLMAAGFYVAVALGLVASSLSIFFSDFPLLDALGLISWYSNSDFLLTAVPMFILMGQLMLHSGVAGAMYQALDKWLSWLPGGLMHTNIASTALFAACSGSSVATAATIGTLSIPNIERGNYNPALYLGSLAAGGTLGILIPPSINLIVYGVLAEKSVPKLYLAALVPGVVLSLLFSLMILLVCILNPRLGGREKAVPLAEKIRHLIHLVPPIAIFTIVVGSIYAGLATATEAASLGVMAALGLAAYKGALSVKIILTAFLSTVQTTCMIMLIITAAFFLNFVMVTIGFIESLTNILLNLNWSPLQTLIAIIVFHLLLGCVMETLSMMIATTPIIVPIVVSIGYDPIWFGVVLVILLETGMITPPYGINLFVIQSVRRTGNFNDVIVGSAPFVGVLIFMVVILVMFPDLALWLPNAVAAAR